MDIIKKTRNDIKAYVKSLNTPENTAYQENELLILSCFAKAQEILEENEGEALTIPVVISRLKNYLDELIDGCEKTAGQFLEIGHEKHSRYFEGQATAYLDVKNYLEVNGL